MRSRLALSIALSLSAAAGRADLRQEVGTTNLTCAVQCQAAHGLRARGDAGGALAALRLARAADPVCARARLEEARLLRETGQVAESAAALRAWLGPLTNQAHSLLFRLPHLEGFRLLARDCLDLGLHEESLRWNTLFKYYDRESQETPSVYRDMAIAQTRLGDEVSALRHEHEAQSHAVNSPGAAGASAGPARFNDGFVWTVPLSPAPTPPALVEGTAVKPALAVWDELQRSMPDGEWINQIVPACDEHAVYVVWGRQPRLTRLDTAKGESSRVELELEAPADACVPLPGGNLLVWPAGSTKVVEVDPAGRRVREMEFPAQVNHGQASPSTGQAIMLAGGKMCFLDLRDGAVNPTIITAHDLALDPFTRQVHLSAPAALNTETIATFASNFPAGWGRPREQGIVKTIQFNHSGIWHLVSVRSHAARAPGTLALAGDGSVAGMVGKAAWSGNAYTNGMVNLFAVNGLRILPELYAMPESQSFEGVALNPVTTDVTLWSEKGLRLYPFRHPDVSFKVQARLGHQAAWSPDGRALVLCGEITAEDQAPGNIAGKGLKVLRLRLETPDLAAGDRRVAALRDLTNQRPRPFQLAGTPVPAAALRPALTTFTPGNDPELARKRAGAALRAAKDTGCPPSWLEVAEYAEPSDLRSSCILAEPFTAETAGARIFKIRKGLPAGTVYPPARALLAQALEAAGQDAEAAEAWIATVREDAGRTNLTLQGLLGAAQALQRAGQAASALDCLATALEVDPASGAARDLLDLHPDGPPLLRATPDQGVQAALNASAAQPPPVYEFPSRNHYPDPKNANLAPFVQPCLVRLDFPSGPRAAGFISAQGLLLTSLEPGDDPLAPVPAFRHVVEGQGRILPTSIGPARRAWADPSRGIAVYRLPQSVRFAPHFVLARTPAEPKEDVFLADIPEQPDSLADFLSGAEVRNPSLEINGVRCLTVSSWSPEWTGGRPLVNTRGELIGLAVSKSRWFGVQAVVSAAEIRAALGLPP